MLTPSLGLRRWFADWDFIENGQNICFPDSAVLKALHGVLHDDSTTVVDCSTGQCNGLDAEGTTNGYSDNQHCGVRIRGPTGSQINLHMAAMNLENGAAACAAGWGGDCTRDDIDYVDIFDGPNDSAPLIARVTGDITDAVNDHDSFTSTGRNMYVKFNTDGG